MTGQYLSEGVDGYVMEGGGRELCRWMMERWVGGRMDLMGRWRNGWMDGQTGGSALSVPPACLDG